MSSLPVSHVTPEEYLDFERGAELKHEYVYGEIVAMSGGSPTHSLIAANIGGALWSALRGRNCRVFNSDLRVSVSRGELVTYPDLSVVCGEVQYLDEKRDTLTNPTFLAEVLSPSTRNFDRGEKARLYRRVPSLKEYLMVEQTPVEIEHCRRLPNGNWELAAIRDLNAVLYIESLGCELAVAEVYLGVEPVGL